MKILSNDPYDIFIFENAMEKEECENIIKFIDSLEGEKLSIKIGNNVECFIWSLEDLENTKKHKIQCKMLINKIHQILDLSMLELSKKIEYIKYDTDSGFHLRKIYGKTKCHVDSISTPNKSYARSLSVILALNDNFDGGEFKFPKHDISIKLKQGSIICFPPYWTHPHEVTSVGNNQFRYTISTWMLEKI
jgi:hypothetical protein